MKILSRKHLVEMSEKEINAYVKQLGAALEKKGWYAKAEAGTLTDAEKKIYDRIMSDFRWIRINAD